MSGDDLLGRVLLHMIARTTPLTPADMLLFAEIGRVALDVIITRGVVCEFGKLEMDGESVCVPAQWRERHFNYHKRTCQHCPVFCKARDAAMI